MEPVQVRHAEEHGPPAWLWFKVPGQASFQKAHQVIFPNQNSEFFTEGGR